MKKVVWTAVVAALILVVAVPAALAVSDSQKTELLTLYEQMHELRLKIIEKQVEAGLVTGDDAASIREHMQERWEWHKQRMEEGDFSMGPRDRMMRRGKFGGGCGFCPAFGSGSQAGGTSF